MKFVRFLFLPTLFLTGCASMTPLADLTYGPFPIPGTQFSQTHEARYFYSGEDVQYDLPHPQDLWINAHAGSVHLYEIRDLNLYSAFSKQIVKLKQIIAEKRTDFPVDWQKDEDYLPDFPATDCDHFYQARIHLLDSTDFNGIAYVAEFGNGITEYTHTDYVYQGISKNGRYYISGLVSLKNAHLPPYNESLDRNKYNIEFGKFVDRCPDSYFTPTVTAVDGWFQSLRIGQ